MIIFGIPLKKRNEESFQKNYEKYYPVVYKQIYYLIGNNRLAEDLTQEAFIKYYNTKTDIKYVGAWLSKVATNTAYNHFRDEKRRMNREEEAIIEETNQIYCIEDGLSRSEDILKVRNILLQLSEQQRICLVLKFSGYSYDEIHQATGISKKNISQLIARGKQKFVSLYKKEGDPDVLYQRSSPTNLG